MDLTQKIEGYKQLLDDALVQIIPHEYPDKLFEAMGYSVFTPGKRVRPICLLAVCEAAGGQQNQALPFACAVELIHSYSLIHDDLPALDNDDSRRGLPANHVVFGEATAILAGDALLNMAYETMARACVFNCDDNHAAAMAEIASSAGARGMIAGQAVDIECGEKTVSADTLLYIHGNKTAALMKASFKAGAILAGADEETLELLEQAGFRLGMAFQIKDDMLDAEAGGEEDPAGRETSEANYVYVHGLEKAKQDYDALCGSVSELLEKVGDPFLIEYAKHISGRDN